jgi:tetratricopeptide (TPR) repeat protein
MATRPTINVNCRCRQFLALRPYFHASIFEIAKVQMNGHFYPRLKPWRPADILKSALMCASCCLLSVSVGPPASAVSPEEAKRAERYWFQSTQRFGDNLESYHDALQNISSVMAIEPHNAKYISEKARIFFDGEEDEEAMKEADKALKEDPNCAGAWNVKALILTRKRKFEEAIACSDKVAKLDPKNGGYWVSRARMLTMANRWDDAEKAIEEAHKLQQSKFCDQNLVGVIALHQKRWQKVIKNADQALAHADSTVRSREFLRQRAEANLNLGNFSLVINDYNKMLRSSPDDRRVRERLVKAYELAGDKNAAARERAKIGQLDADLFGTPQVRQKYERTYLPQSASNKADHLLK